MPTDSLPWHPGTTGRAVPRRAAAMPAGRPLTSDKVAEIALHAEAGNLGERLSKRQVTEEQAVARLALISPGRLRSAPAGAEVPTVPSGPRSDAGRGAPRSRRRGCGRPGPSASWSP